LLEYWKDRHVDLQLQVEQRFQAQEKALEGAMMAQRAAIDAALAAQHLATTKAEASVEVRFQSVNEFRATLADQQARFVPRAEVENAIGRNAERIQELGARFHTTATKQEVITAFDGLNTRLSELGERVTRAEGRGSGLTAGWGYLMPIFLVIATVIAAYITAKGH
jgi:hypothetical protein